MVTDKQRREVAQELRELRHTTYYCEEVVENIRDAISIADPVNTFREPEDVYKLLADLIDRETCSNEGSGNRFVCSACRYKFVDDSDYAEDLDWAFCPNCGAEVVEDD